MLEKMECVHHCLSREKLYMEMLPYLSKSLFVLRIVILGLMVHAWRFCSVWVSFVFMLIQANYSELYSVSY